MTSGDIRRYYRERVH